MRRMCSKKERRRKCIRRVSKMKKGFDSHYIRALVFPGKKVSGERNGSILDGKRD